MTEPIDYTVSTGNVYADLNIPNPEEALLKADLAMRISDLIEEKRLTQSEAARVLGVRQPNISKLMRGQLRGFSVGRMLKFLLALDQDVELVIRPRPEPSNQASPRMHLTVLDARSGK